ncbi:MAG: hypothetical protein MI748_14110 [Opitutales bacterium]|nr:hypothetical protein [Opitutales bacterium]
MKIQIKKFTYVQNTKVVAGLYFFLGLFYIPMGLIMFLTTEGPEKYSAIMFLVMPIASFIFVPIGCAIYNLIAKIMGGIEFIQEEVNE